MKSLNFSKWLMVMAILVIAAFQSYWIVKLYNEEFNHLQSQTDVLLKQSIQALENKRFDNDSTLNLLIKKANLSSQKNKKTQPFINIKNKLGVKKEQIIKDSTTIESKDNKSDTASLQFYNNQYPKGIITIKNGSSNSFHNVDSVLKLINPNSIKSISFISDSSKYLSNSENQKGLTIKRSFQSRDTITKAIFFTKRNTVKDSTNTKEQSSISFSASIKVDSSKNYNVSTIFMKFLTDSIPTSQVDSAYAVQLKKDKVNIPFKLIVKKKEEVEHDSVIPSNKLTTSFTGTGFMQPLVYKAEFKNPFFHIAKKLALPFTISLLLLAFVTTAFVVLYKNMESQRKMALMKNEFISNITHELKTPIATVSVAVEALKNFNALNNPQKTKEYLEISASEITRLSLLVDNVLKLSMFENDKIELNKQNFDLIKLTNEILNALSIQIEQQNAIVQFNSIEDSIYVDADQLHISSVLFNLVDNALKYAKDQPIIAISLVKKDHFVLLTVKDDGIGIAKENQLKIFNKFFRVSQGENKHNIKGYGLGLSYVYYIIKKHEGDIKVESDLGKGTSFIITLPL